MQIQGTITGWTPDFYEMPTYNDEPADFRLKLLVPDAADVVEELSDAYDEACAWYRDATGKKNFYDAPFEMNEDGSAVVRLTAKPAYGEFPLPVVDAELNPLARDLKIREGSLLIVAIKTTYIPRKSPKGGLRLCPKGIQVLKAVTLNGQDSGDFDVATAFKKTKGFKQAAPNVQELATVGGDSDTDF
jgi:hypothetical protein